MLVFKKIRRNENICVVIFKIKLIFCEIILFVQLFHGFNTCVSPQFGTWDSTGGRTHNRRFNAKMKIFLSSLCRHHSPHSLLISSTHFLGNVFVKEQCGRGSVSRIMT